MPKSIIVYQQKISICKTDKLFLPIEGTSNMNIIYMRTRCYVYYLYTSIQILIYPPYLRHSLMPLYLPSLPLLTHCEIMRRGQWQAQDQRSPPTSSSSFTIIFFTKMTFSTPHCPVILLKDVGRGSSQNGLWSCDLKKIILCIRKLGIHTM